MNQVRLSDFGKVDSAFFAYASDDEIRFRASSGGFVKSFLVYLLESGSVDYAIITRTGGPASPLEPETVITDSRDDIVSARTNSVYAVHDPFPVFSRIASDKTYAFVGLPCHVRKLRAAQARGKYHNVRMVVGLLCNHTPNVEFTRDVLNKLGVQEQDLHGIEYRGHGWPGMFTATLKDGRQKRIALFDYWSNDLNNGPRACAYCAMIAEGADLVVGDPWNLDLERSEAKGQSLVLCRTRDTARSVRQAAKHGYIGIARCSGRQLMRSQGYHIKDKLSRGTQRTQGVTRQRVKQIPAAWERVLGLARHNGAITSALWKLARGPVLLLRLLKAHDGLSAMQIICRVPVLRGLLKRVLARRVLVWYWREERRLINLGDYVTEVLLGAFGYKVVRYCDAKTLGILDRFPSCLLVIGSEFHRERLETLAASRFCIWGQGKGYGTPIDMRTGCFQDRVHVCAVRGPHTVRQLGLPETTPLGDPALLLPLFFPIRKMTSQHCVSYVPHWSNRSGLDVKQAQVGADKSIDIMCSRRHFWRRCRELVSSRFVLTNSLHAAIICHAYRTPWALCLAEGDHLNFPDKWRDFLEFLGVEGVSTVRNFEEGLEWWRTLPPDFSPRALLPLMDAFPLPIRNRRALRVIEELRAIQSSVRKGEYGNETHEE